MKLNKNKLIHIVGVGGIGMSGIAEILSEMGYQVQGSDIKINVNIVRLNKKKIKTFNSHKQSNLKNVSLVVYSSAISKNNIELEHSKKIKIPSISRAEILSQIVKLKKTIAISGSHGKTTTTSLISAVLNGARMKPTVINGGIINQFGTNTKLGSGDWLVVEADESDGTFVKLPASISVVTNIDKEHLDYYSNFQNLKNYFKRFITQVPFYGFAVICIDDNELRKLATNISTTKIIRTGFHRESDIKCVKLRHKANETIFDVFVKEQNQTIKNIKLPLHGAYNVNNALAAIAVGLQLNVKPEIIKKSLNSFKGVQRRLTELWSNNNIRVVDDYAHHPTEINNVLKGLVDKRLSELGERGLVLVATSGDTGSAAIQAVKDSENIDIVVLHPANKISEYQRKQMTSVIKDNVFNIAVEGSYDDCQRIAKEILSDNPFERRIISLNSINWLRVMGQVSYYVWLTKQFTSPINVAIPSGNFGNAYSAWFGRSNGLKINQIMCTTNVNDVLKRFIDSGTLEPQTTKPSVAPSMDIQIPSSLERLIYDFESDASSFYQDLIENKKAMLSEDSRNKLQHIFSSQTFDDEKIKEEIKAFNDLFNIVFDPHTVTSLRMAIDINSSVPTVAVATASPDKFSNVITPIIEDFPVSEINKDEDFETLGPQKDQIIESIKAKFS